MTRFFLLLFSTVLIAGSLVGCGSGGPAEPPPGWSGERTGQELVRWWKSDVDTTGLFPALTSFETMGIGSDAIYGLADLQQGDVDVILQALRYEYLPLFRHDPQLLDSLFNHHIPALFEEPGATRIESRDDLLELKRRGYSLLRRSYREPAPTLQIGTDIPLVYPDSLRKNGIGGNVAMQVHVTVDGQPNVIRLLAPVHPVLDTHAMLATTKMIWSPAYLDRNPVESFVRFSLQFTPDSTDLTP